MGVLHSFIWIVVVVYQENKMSVLDLTVLCLSALNAFQLLYWSWQTHKLVNKLMSRNYAEYNYVKAPLASVPKTQDFESVNQNEEVLQELNAMIG